MYEDNIDVGKDQLSLSLFFFLISLHTLSHVRFTLDAIAANIIWQVWLAVGRWGTAGQHCWVDNCSLGAWIGFGKSDRCTLAWLKIAWMCIIPTCGCVDYISKAKWNQLVHPLQAEILCDLVFPQEQKSAFLLFLLWGQLTDRNDGQNQKTTTILLMWTGQEVQYVDMQGSWLMG